MKHRITRLFAVPLVLVLAVTGLTACHGGPHFSQKTVGTYGGMVLGKIYRDSEVIASYMADPGDKFIIHTGPPDAEGDPTGEADVTIEFQGNPNSSAGNIETFITNGWTYRNSFGKPDIVTYARAQAKLLSEAVGAPEDEDDPTNAANFAAQDSAMTSIVAQTEDRFAAASNSTFGVTPTEAATDVTTVEVTVPGPTQTSNNMNDDADANVVTGAALTSGGPGMAVRPASARPSSLLHGDVQLVKQPCYTRSWTWQGVKGGVSSCGFVYQMMGDGIADYQYYVSETWSGAFAGSSDFAIGRLGLMQDVNEVWSRIVKYSPHGFIHPGSCQGATVSLGFSVGPVSAAVSQPFTTCPTRFGAYHEPIIEGNDTMGTEWVGLQAGKRTVGNVNDVAYRRRVGHNADWRMQTSIRFKCRAALNWIDCGTLRFP